MRQDGRGARRTIQAECGSRFNLESRLTKEILVAPGMGIRARSAHGPEQRERCGPQGPRSGKIGARDSRRPPLPRRRRAARGFAPPVCGHCCRARALRGLCTTGAAARIDRDIASPCTREAVRHAIEKPPTAAASATRLSSRNRLFRGGLAAVAEAPCWRGFRSPQHSTLHFFVLAWPRSV